MGDISGGLAGKRARINGTDSVRGGEIVVKAQVPLSELEGYAAEHKSVTAGRGRDSLDFRHYEPVPAQVQQKREEASRLRHDEDCTPHPISGYRYRVFLRGGMRKGRT